MISPSPFAHDEELGIVPAGSLFSWPTLPVNQADLLTYLHRCMAAPVHYGLGAKADAGGRRLTAFPPSYSAIDCSGWVRAALAFATMSRERPGGVVLPDGSVVQHDWIAAHGFKISSVSALLLQDGALRICFIAPNWQHPVGHVYLVRNGRTLESYGGHGPGSRSPLVHVLHFFTTSVYVLTPPEVDR